MKISCNQCQLLNESGRLFCSNCKNPLLSQAAIVETLMEKQAEMESRHQQEFQALKEQLNFFKQTVNKGQVQTEQKETQENIVPTVTVSIPEVVQEESTPELRRVKERPAPRKNVPPSPMSLAIRGFFQPIFDGSTLVLNVYEKYKSEGKLPIFFMTITGIIAILFGFGYLMQYSFQYLGKYEEVSKIFLGFVAAIGVGSFGIYLFLKDEKWQEYASALIALGLILNYLMIYFLSDIGDFPLLSSSIVGFSLIMVNTTLASILSLKFKTKIVSVLSLLGGAFAPFYLNSTSDGTLYYLYLWFLTVGANYVAYQIKWKTLQYLSFIVSVLLLEIAVFTYFPDTLVFNIYYHLFAYLFFYIAFFDKLSLKEKLEKTDVIIIAGNLSFFVFNLYSSNSDELVELGLMLLFNGLAFCGFLFRRWNALSKNMRLVFFIVIGSLIGFAIPALFDQVLFGLFWSIEAVLLIVLGFIYAMPLVRKEGYIILLIAFAKLLMTSYQIVTDWGYTILNEGLINFLVLGALITFLWKVGQKYTKEFVDFEASLYTTFKEIVPFWGTVVFFIVAHHFLGVWSLNLAIIPLFGLIFWKKQYNTQYSDFLGLANLLLLLYSVSLSISEVHSIHLSDQTLYAQIAAIEFLAALWFIQKFYEFIKVEGAKTFGISKILRITFFVLLPLIFITQVNRNASEFLSAGIWIGMFIAYFLHKKTQYKALLHELHILLAIGFIHTVMGLDTVGSIAALMILLVISFIEKAFRNESLKGSAYLPLLTATPYAMAVSISILHYNLIEENIGSSVALGTTILFAIIYFKDYFPHISGTQKEAIKLSALLNCAGLLFMFFDNSYLGFSYTLINIVLFTLLLLNSKSWYDLEAEKKRWGMASVFLQVQIVLSYSLILEFMGIDLDGVAFSVLLVIHAIALLFMSMKNDIKILSKSSFVLFGLALVKLVFHDIADFSTAQKIIVLIIIGVLLLAASYLFVRLKKHFESVNLEGGVEEESNL